MKRLIILLALGASSFCSSAIAEKPNFVWLISEDNSKHYLNLYDQTGAETPRIKQLAREGLIFNHAFSNSPVCSVARTTLLTACYGPRIGTQYHRRSKLAAMPDGLRMFPAYLRQAGYYTTNKQKKDYNAIEGDGVWDASSRRASWKNRKPDQPFFHMQSFGSTHESSLHFSLEVMANENTKTDPRAVTVAPYHPDTRTFRYTVARYHDRIQLVDQQIGEVVDQLEQDGLLDNTFIFYFGDHGGVLPRGKGYAYESGLHVPLVVRIPEKWKHLAPAARGTRQDGFVSFVDFGPTLLNLAGIEIPSQIDGRPFLGKGVTVAELNQRDEAFGYADRFDEKYDLVRSLRKGKFKYIRNYQPFNFDGLQNNYRYRMLAYEEWRTLFEAGKLNSVQAHFFRSRRPEALYDLEVDPHETRNLVDDLRYRKHLVDLRDRLHSRMIGMPDLSMIPESEMVENGLDAPAHYGQKQKERIKKVVEIADSSLSDFDHEYIDKNLSSDDPLVRYWSIIASTASGEGSRAIAGRVRELAKSDPNILVRVRAAEYLSIVMGEDPRPVIRQCLKAVQSGVEAGLILNTVALLRDGPTKVPFSITEKSLTPDVLKNDVVKRRLEYFAKDTDQ